MRTLLMGGVLAILAFALSACGGSSGSSASDQALQQKADNYAISQIERDFHESMSKKDIDQMVGLFAPNATVTFGPGKTVTGTEQIRKVWLGSKAFEPATQLVVRPSRIQAQGHRSTETAARCTSSVTSSTSTPERSQRSRPATRRREDRRPVVDHELRGQHCRAEDLSTCRERPSPDAGREQPARRKRRLLSPADNPLVRAVGRVPAGVHAKLLVAFVGTALLVVVVGVLGLRLLGQSNERVETLGTLQVRAFAYGKLRSDAGHVRGLLAQRVGGDFYKVFPEQNQRGARGRRPGCSTRRSRAKPRLLPASTFPDKLGFRPPPEDEQLPAQDPGNRRAAREEAAGDRRRRPHGSWTSGLPSRRGRAARHRPRPATRPSSRTPRPARTDALIAQNASAYEHSRNLFIGVAAGAIVLALLLGIRPLVVGDRANPAHRLPAGRDRLRATSRGTWTSGTATSSVRWRRT